MENNGISEMLNSVLSNPEAISKIMTMMPAVAQMMNNSNNNNNNGGSSDKISQPSEKTERIIETAASANTPASGDIMANAEVANALKNLVAALNSASGTANNTNNNINNGPDNSEEKEEAIPAFSQSEINNNNTPDTGDFSSARIEKTLDTLKNFSSATSPESDNRSKLLLALKPFLKDGRKTKIDTAIKYMNAAKIITMFGKNGFV
ncbi:MAG: hypothetical protein FWH10_00350 [Oscillospiraceae bacterium]|nr:hypothetical protein [Oscillospiraceae bacterium]